MRIPIVMALLLSFVVALAACDEEAMYQDSIAKAIATTAEARSFRATVYQITVADIYVHSWSSEEEFVAPDRWHLLYTVIVDGGGDVGVGVGDDPESRSPGEWSEIVTVGHTGYVRQSDRPEWTARPGLSVAQPPEKQLERYKFLVDVGKLPDEEIRGVTCSHYRGRVDQDAYVDMMTEEIEEYGDEDTPEHSQFLESTRGDEYLADLWIDENDYIRQIQRTARFLDPLGKRLDSFMIARYFDYNEQITISAPSDAQPSWPTPTPMPPPAPTPFTPSGTT
jgi:hypothetical protein